MCNRYEENIIDARKIQKEDNTTGSKLQSERIKQMQEYFLHSFKDNIASLLQWGQICTNNEIPLPVFFVNELKHMVLPIAERPNSYICIRKNAAGQVNIRFIVEQLVSATKYCLFLNNDGFQYSILPHPDEATNICRADIIEQMTWELLDNFEAFERKIYDYMDEYSAKWKYPSAYEDMYMD